MSESAQYFFCGVGGSGMAPLALIVQARGATVEGSDRALDQGRGGAKFDFLRSRGLRLHPQDGSGLTRPEQTLVASAAVEETVPDVQAARRVGAPTMIRAELLARLFNAAPVSVGVAGTSGKSTVTGMIAWILHGAGLAPTVMNGAEMKNFITPDQPFASALLGGPDLFVSEVDESDGSIALYDPTVAVVNNVALDHKTMDELRALFRAFTAKAKTAVLNLDSEETAALAAELDSIQRSFPLDGGRWPREAGSDGGARSAASASGTQPGLQIHGDGWPPTTPPSGAPRHLPPSRGKGDVRSWGAAEADAGSQDLRSAPSDDDGLRGRKVVTYSLADPAADLLAADIVPAPDGVAFTLRAGDAAIPVRLQVPGRHNVANALAAIAAATGCGVPLAAAAKALDGFTGIRRRLEVVGTANGVTVIDDFAHNPDKLSATLDTLHAFPGRLLMMFQPHGFGPLRLMRREFVDAFAGKLAPGDVLLMPEPVYFGGTVDRSVGSRDIAADLTARGGRAEAFPDRPACGARLLALARPGDRIVVTGARDDTLSLFAAEVLAGLGAQS